MRKGCSLILACLLLGHIPMASSYQGSYSPGLSPLKPASRGPANQTSSWGYAQGIGISITNIGNINLAGGTFQVTHVLL